MVLVVNNSACGAEAVMLRSDACILDLLVRAWCVTPAV